MSGAHALLTTPGASKWYRSAGPEAAQRLRFDVEDDATLEWPVSYTHLTLPTKA